MWPRNPHFAATSRKERSVGMATSIAYAGGTIMHFNLKNIISQLSLQQFKSDERGAVTVDWVVLTVQNGVANASIGPKDNN